MRQLQPVPLGRALLKVKGVSCWMRTTAPMARDDSSCEPRKICSSGSIVPFPLSIPRQIPLRLLILAKDVPRISTKGEDEGRSGRVAGTLFFCLGGAERTRPAGSSMSHG